MKKVEAIIQGQVQGIGFRYWVRRKFEKLGIEGDVWNNEDRTVGVEFSGTEKQNKEMLKLLKQGSPLARVDKVVIL